MRYISVFSGIEAATVAWEGLGWEPACFAEVDAFPSAVLAERFPGVPNLGDVTKVNWKRYRGKVDLVVGGSPCQSFSIAGKREGLQGESGLMYEYVRCVHEVRPRWFLWENVPGALSSSHGEDFRCLLSEMDKLGYGLAWRVLDAQFFGVAQRRRRLFLVGRLGERPPVEVLFEPDCLRGDHPTSKQKREELARAARNGAESPGGKGSGAPPAGLGAWALAANTIDRQPQNGGNGLGASEELCYTLTAMDRHAVSASAGPLNPWDNQTSRVYYEEGIAPTLTSNAAGGYKGGAVLDCGDAAYALKIRGGCEGGGKGALIQEDVSATLSTRQDQTIFQPAAGRDGKEQSGSIVYGLCSASSNSMKSGNPHSGVYVADTSRTLDVGCANPACNQGGMMVVQGGQAGSNVAIPFAANQRGEVRIQGDGTLTGAIPASQSGKQVNGVVTQYGEELAGTLAARHDGSPCADRGQNIVCLGDDNAKASVDVDVCGTLKCGGSAPIAGLGSEPRAVVRRLTPVECERLQGFPDDWTAIPWRGKPAGECPDAPRYKAIGNSMAVPVMRWIGRRLGMADRGEIR